MPSWHFLIWRSEPSGFRSGTEAGGSTLIDLNLRHRYQVTVLALRREEGLVANPAGSERLGPGDVVVMMGTSSDLATAAEIFQIPEETEP